MTDFINKPRGEQIADYMADLSLCVWESMRGFFLAKKILLCPPDTCAGDDGRIMLSWSMGPHYLECEILPAGYVEYFYFNADTDGVWGDTCTHGTPFTDEVFDHLEHFAVTSAQPWGDAQEMP